MGKNAAQFLKEKIYFFTGKNTPKYLVCIIPHASNSLNSLFGGNNIFLFHKYLKIFILQINGGRFIEFIIF